MSELFLRRALEPSLKDWLSLIDAIPKNPYGKVLKRELREKYWVGEARRVR